MGMLQDHANVPDPHEFASEGNAKRHTKGPHIRVEYDLRWTGGTYSDSGLHSDYVYVPCALIERLGSVEQALTELNESVPLRILSSSQELYQENGDPWEETAASLPASGEEQRAIDLRSFFTSISFGEAEPAHQWFTVGDFRLGWECREVSDQEWIDEFTLYEGNHLRNHNEVREDDQLDDEMILEMILQFAECIDPAKKPEDILGTVS